MLAKFVAAPRVPCVAIAAENAMNNEKSRSALAVVDEMTAEQRCVLDVTTVQRLRTNFATRASSLSTSLSVAMLIGLGWITIYGLGVSHSRHAKSVAVPPQATFEPVPAQRVKSFDVTSPAIVAQRRGEGSPPPAQNAAVPPGEIQKAPESSLRPAKKSEGVPSEPAASGPDAWPSADVKAALQDCDRQLASISATVEVMQPIKLGQCGTPAPVTLRSIGLSKVELQAPAITTCRMVVALQQWIDGVVQPTAQDVYKSQVKRVNLASSYACRNRNSQAAGPISEHAVANAVDISGFVLEDGRTITILHDWGATARDQKSSGSASTKNGVPGSPPGAILQLGGPIGPASPVTPAPSVLPASTPSNASTAATNESRFLHQLHQGACGIFGTVLGPEANEFHRDHLHIDLKVRKFRAFCE